MGAWAGEPNIAPDGTAIVLDGKNSRRIADSGLFTDPEHWKPNP
jgi:hypothetical protein